MAEEQSEETKMEARAFMSGLIGSGDSDAVTEGGPPVDMTAFESFYTNSARDSAVLETFWSDYYNPKSTSLWTMVYDEADSNETLEETIQIAKEFMKKMPATMKDHCFGIIHTLENLETKGLFFFNGPDPEQLFGANEDTSWFTWNKIGPDVNDYVKAAVAPFLAPEDGTLHGTFIKDTQIF